MNEQMALLLERLGANAELVWPQMIQKQMIIGYLLLGIVIMWFLIEAYLIYRYRGTIKEEITNEDAGIIFGFFVIFAVISMLPLCLLCWAIFIFLFPEVAALQSLCGR